MLRPLTKLKSKQKELRTKAREQIAKSRKGAKDHSFLGYNGKSQGKNQTKDQEKSRNNM